MIVVLLLLRVLFFGLLTFFCGLLWSFVVFCGLLWSFVVIHGRSRFLCTFFREIFCRFFQKFSPDYCLVFV